MTHHDKQKDRVDACRTLADMTPEPTSKLLLAQLAHTYATMPEPKARETLPSVAKRQKCPPTRARCVDGADGRRSLSSPK